MLPYFSLSFRYASHLVVVPVPFVKLKFEGRHQQSRAGSDQPSIHLFNNELGFGFPNCIIFIYLQPTSTVHYIRLCLFVHFKSWKRFAHRNPKYQTYPNLHKYVCIYLYVKFSTATELGSQARAKARHATNCKMKWNECLH